MEGLILNIQRFSTKDGPGIRTTVFFKGCNVNCAWCHNPESIDGSQVLRFDAKRCVSCGRCAEVCPAGATVMSSGIRVYEHEKCIFCGKCAAACGADALEVIGEKYSLEQLFDILMKDLDFYKESGGGVTFSGGEPLLQLDFLVETLKQLKDAGIHTAVDTALNVKWAAVEKILPYTDLFLLDIKGMNYAEHNKNTGVDPSLIHQNMKRLSAKKVDQIVRMPLVKGLNDSLSELEAAAEFVRSWPHLKGVELLAYHSLGVDKSKEYEAIKKQEKFEPPAAERLKEAVRIFRSKGVCNVT